MSARQFKAVTFLTAGMMGLLAGCANLAPEYEQPATQVAEQWSDRVPAPPEATELLQWRDFFLDTRLQAVIDLALENSPSARLATLNVQRARALYRVQGAAVYPSIAATGSGSVQRIPVSLSPAGAGGSGSGAQDYISRQYSVGVGLTAYELDLFGRVANLKSQALEAYLSQEATRRSVELSLMSEVASAWLQLAADEALLALARDTLESQTQSFKLTERSYEAGVASALAVAQARTIVESARADVAAFTSQVQQDRNALQLLVGVPIPQTLKPTADDMAPVDALAELPAGVSSEVLLNRPDVVAAEHQLIASNANIGVARAARFPSISLTGFAGTASSDLSTLFDAGTGTWSFAPQISIPIFNAGAAKAGVAVAEADQQIALAQYEQAVQVAFKEAADALALRQTIDDQLAARQALTDAAARAQELSDARYRSGIDSYLNLLDAQRSLYAAQQQLINTRLSRQSNLVTLYKVMGGSWS